jgi:primosomal protein N'
MVVVDNEHSLVPKLRNQQFFRVHSRSVAVRMARRTLSRFGLTETMASLPGQWAIIQFYYANVWRAFVI